MAQRIPLAAMRASKHSCNALDWPSGATASARRPRMHTWIMIFCIKQPRLADVPHYILMSLCAQRHNRLLLSKPGFANTDFLETSFNAYGVPYDVVRIDTSNVENLATTAFWYNTDGSAKYSGIAMTPSFEGDGTMNKAQVTAM